MPLFNKSLILKQINSNVVSSIDFSQLYIEEFRRNSAANFYTENADVVSKVQVLPNGRVVVGTGNGNVKVWHPETQASRVCDTGKWGKRIEAVAALPKGLIACGSQDWFIKIFNVDSGRLVATINQARSATTALAALPNGQLVSGSIGDAIKIWDVETGECVRVLNDDQNTATCVKALIVLPNDQLASGSWNNTIQIWDLKTGACLKTLIGSANQYLTSLCLLTDGRLASGSFSEAATLREQTNIQVWDYVDDTLTALPDVSAAGVLALTQLPDNRLVSAGADGKFNFWDVDAQKRVLTHAGHEQQVSTLAVLPDGRLVSGSSDKSVGLFYVGIRCLRMSDISDVLKALKTNTSVTALNLQQLSVMDQHVESSFFGSSLLLQLLQANTVITSVDLRNNKITVAGVQKIKEALLERTSPLNLLHESVPVDFRIDASSSYVFMQEALRREIKKIATSHRVVGRYKEWKEANVALLSEEESVNVSCSISTSTSTSMSASSKGELLSSHSPSSQSLDKQEEEFEDGPELIGFGMRRR